MTDLAIINPMALALERTLARAGWQILGVDIDMTRETARIELRRGDLQVTFDARNGKASTTRERVETRTERRGRKGDIYMSETIHMRFIGRERHEGARSGLRWLTNYVADNGTGAITAGEVRRIIAPMMTVAATAEGYVYSDPVIARVNAEIEATLAALREHDLIRAREISFTLRIKDL